MGAPPPTREVESQSRPARPRFEAAAARPAAPVGGTGPLEAAGSPTRGRRGRKRASGSISPITGISHVYEERKATTSLIKILLAVLITFAIAVGIVVITRKNFREPPAGLRAEDRPAP